jgi:hypothetical protein
MKNHKAINEIVNAMTTLFSRLVDALDQDSEPDPHIERSVQLAAGPIVCGAVAIPCLPLGQPGACTREAHDHPPCTRPYGHDGHHSWQVEAHDQREASDPHAKPVITYALPAPPPLESRVTNGIRVWTQIDHTGDISLWRDLDRPDVVPIPWSILLEYRGPLRLVEDQGAEDIRLYGPRGARWGNPDRPCWYGFGTTDAVPCQLGENHAGPHKDIDGAVIGATEADGSNANAGISPAQAAEVPCTCGHPDAHWLGCPRRSRITGICGAPNQLESVDTWCMLPAGHDGPHGNEGP